LSCVNLLKNDIPVQQAQELVKIKESKPILKSLCGLTMDETELDFSSQDLRAGGAVLLASDIQDMGSLSRLDLSGNNEYGSDSPGFIRPIASALKTNTSITELSLSGNKLNAEAAEILSGGIQDSRSLSSLNILKNMIGEEQAQALIKIKHEKKMTTLCGLKGSLYLNLSGKMNGAADALVLADEIKDMGSLVSLNLAECGLGVAGAKHVAEVLPKW
jgi:hypothetical protein